MRFLFGLFLVLFFTIPALAQEDPFEAFSPEEEPAGDYYVDFTVYYGPTEGENLDVMYTFRSQELDGLEGEARLEALRGKTNLFQQDSISYCDWYLRFDELFLQDRASVVRPDIVEEIKVVLRDHTPGFFYCTDDWEGELDSDDGSNECTVGQQARHIQEVPAEFAFFAKWLTKTNNSLNIDSSITTFSSENNHFRPVLAEGATEISSGCDCYASWQKNKKGKYVSKCMGDCSKNKECEVPATHIAKCCKTGNERWPCSCPYQKNSIPEPPKECNAKQCKSKTKSCASKLIKTGGGLLNPRTGEHVKVPDEIVVVRARCTGPPISKVTCDCASVPLPGWG